MTQPAPNPLPQPSPADTNRRWTIAEKTLSVLASILTVVAAGLAVQSAQISSARDQAQQAQESTNENLTSLQQQFSKAKDENAALQSENTRLREQLDLPEGSTSLPLPTDTITVRHSGPLSLAYRGNVADLDSPASDPQWQTSRSDVDYGPSNSKPSLRFSYPALATGTTVADYEVCRNMTGYNVEAFDASSFTIGGHFCVKTSEDRYSVLEVTEISDRRLSLEVTTYDPPGT